MARLSRILLLSALGLGCSAQTAEDKPAEKPGIKVEFRRAEDKPAEGLTEATVGNTKEKVYLHKTADATNEDIADARVDTLNDPVAVIVVFTKEGAKKMAKLSEGHQGKPLAILVDGKVICAPIVRATVRDQATITGLSSKEEAERIVRGLKGR
jgi:preprotein translocase subunit SecD